MTQRFSEKLKEQKLKLYDWLELDLTAAKVNEQRGVSGSMIYVYDAPAVANIFIRFNELNNDAIPLKKGMRIEVPFWRFFLTSDALPGGTIKIAIGKDPDFDLTQLGLINVDTISQPVKQQAANNWDLGGSPLNVNDTAGGTLIKAANAGRQSLSVKVESGNPVAFGKNGVVFAGGAGVAGRILLAVGDSYVFNHTQEVRGICGAGLAAVVLFEEEYNT